MSNQHYYNWQYQHPIICVAHKVCIEEVILPTLLSITYTMLLLGKHYYACFYKQNTEDRKANIQLAKVVSRL